MASRDLGWLIARPIAHRGLHDAASGVIENCPKAFAAAIAGHYAIECDVQPSADGEAVVFHDQTLDRLTLETGRVDARPVDALKAVRFKATDDRMLTLSELFDQVAGQVPLVVEIKSEFDGKLALTRRVAALAGGYRGPLALMSFDPAVIAWLKDNAPDLTRGIVAESDHDRPHLTPAERTMRRDLAALAHFPATDPHFLSWKIADMPNAATVLFRSALKRPVICWTVRSDDDRLNAARYADQVTFEGYRA
ncbi:glycerophosphodiester phosphodiesterase family protein [Phreatobacter stygius]|uniref:Glycerophosphodiester phosphodiesterase n=1 Tax=Phreatobacter stygius TaxID=1940610 RepID=A0A4D7BKA3_9HYPH|nr:glycerophosphodiester phosphodiesterase family protein [Phreatobacter stygius]QCI68192.1 glycerophosphodiester phosphodiesterase [Phreatobacter stygius]